MVVDVLMGCQSCVWNLVEYRCSFPGWLMDETAPALETGGGSNHAIHNLERIPANEPARAWVTL